MNAQKFTKRISIFLTCLLIFSGCSLSKNTSNSPKGEVEQVKTDKEENASAFTDDFKMDKEERTGFMKADTQNANNFAGYTEIHTIEDFKTHLGKKGKYVLMEDLDLSGETWTIQDFVGDFDGNYHILKGLKRCLFGRLAGTVKNLGLEDVDVNDVAALAKYVYGGEVSNCYVTGNVTGNAGLIAEIEINNATYYGHENYNSIIVKDCYNKAKVDNDDTTEAIGGIVGDMSLSGVRDVVSVNISGCENYGELEGNDEVGGIVGRMERDSAYSGVFYEADVSCVINSCFNFGEIKGNTYAGGIIGDIHIENESKQLKNIFTIGKCANYGKVSTEKIGENDKSGYCGGICGHAWLDVDFNEINAMVELSIENCLNAGEASNDSGNGAEICGATDMNGAKCIISKCLGIGGQKDIESNRTTVFNTYPILECTDCYTSSDIKIADMKDMKRNLPMFDYPYTWGIDEYFCGFPHPYGGDEYEAVYKYAREKQNIEVENVVENSDSDEIIRNQHYADALEMMCMGGYWPDDVEMENYSEYLLSWSDDAETYFDICDIDKDGSDDLVVKSLEYYYAIYNYDVNAGKLERKFFGEGQETWDKEYGDNTGLDWKLMKAGSFSTYTDAYMAYYEKIIEKELPKDIGLVFLQNDRNVDSLMSALTSDYGIEANTIDEVFIEGKYQGETVFSVFLDSGGSFEYRKKMDGVTLFGIYPGMDETEAKEMISQYGFYMGNYSYKMGDCLLHLQMEGGKVSNISLSSGSEYVG